MKKLLLILPILAILPAKAFASNSSANVDIHNNVSSSSDSQTTSHTSITTETNGKVTHYESDQPGSVHVESVNGESKITVDGKEVTPTVSNSDQTGSPTPTAKPTEGKVDNDQEKKDEEDFKDKIIEQLKRPFRIFEKIFQIFEH